MTRRAAHKERLQGVKNSGKGAERPRCRMECPICVGSAATWHLTRQWAVNESDDKDKITEQCKESISVLGIFSFWICNVILNYEKTLRKSVLGQNDRSFGKKALKCSLALDAWGR
jgi:hypothetical protein